MTGDALMDLAFLDALIRRIGPERLTAFDSYGNIHLVDDKAGHALASELGLTKIRVLSSATCYGGEIDGHEVHVFASLREYEHVVFLDSNPAAEPGGASFERYPTAEAAALAAQTAYGHVRWEQSGADEYAFTDRNGRRGYVVVRQFTKAVPA